MTDCNGIELVTHVKVWAQGALHSRPETGDRNAECDRDVVDDVLKRVIIDAFLDGRERTGPPDNSL